MNDCSVSKEQNGDKHLPSYGASEKKQMNDKIQWWSRLNKPIKAVDETFKISRNY